MTSGVLIAMPLLVLVVGGWLIHHPIKPRSRPEPKPEDWGRHPDDFIWESEASSQVHRPLTDIRESANKWSQSIAGLLGVFGIAVFLKGAEQLADVPGDDAYVVGAVLMAAVLFAAAAVYLAAIAAQGVPRHLGQFDGWTLKELQRLAIGRTVKLFAWSRLVSVVAALLLVIGAIIGSLSALTDREGPRGVWALVVLKDGSVKCGSLEQSDDGLLLNGAPLGEAKDVTLVDKCP